ncbi:Hypothetical Protein RSKD131_0654 [Cereibacter sphaeroides KD131]|nr:Hypothetical Protein RSKD131_0654 [Cereibacter sphaeroides KD131]
MNSLVVLSFGPGRWSPPSGRAQGHAQRQLRRRSARAATARRGVAELIAMVRSRVMARILRSRAQKESAKVTVRRFSLRVGPALSIAGLQADGAMGGSHCIAAGDPLPASACEARPPRR